MDPLMEKRRKAEYKNFSKGIVTATNNCLTRNPTPSSGNVYELN